MLGLCCLCKDLGCVASTLGALVLLKVLYDIVSGIHAKFFRAGKDLTKYVKWAIVTGATDGIGKAMAFELARKKLNVLIVSRTQSKLDETKAEISAKYSGVTVETLAIDFSNVTDKEKAAIKKAVDSKEGGFSV